jgi:hypothetical protein
MEQIEAVYRGGTFLPLAPPHLAEDQRVRLTVQPMELQNVDEWLADVRRRHEDFVAKHGFLPGSTPDIAADRLR